MSRPLHRLGCAVLAPRSRRHQRRHGHGAKTIPKKAKAEHEVRLTQSLEFCGFDHLLQR